MATSITTLFSSTLTISSRTIQPKQATFLISKPTFVSSFISTKTFSSTLVPRLSDTIEAPSVVVEDEVEEVTDVGLIVEEEVVEVEKVKGEGLFAVVMIGGRQYIVHPGRYLTVQRLKGANVNDKIILSKVLLVGTNTSAYIGKPIVPNAAVHAVVEDQGLNDKVIVYKYKKKKNYRRNIGHRQPNTRIRIIGITGYQDSPVVTLDDLPVAA